MTLDRKGLALGSSEMNCQGRCPASRHVPGLPHPMGYEMPGDSDAPAGATPSCTHGPAGTKEHPGQKHGPVLTARTRAPGKDTETGGRHSEGSKGDQRLAVCAHRWGVHTGGECTRGATEPRAGLGPEATSGGGGAELGAQAPCAAAVRCRQTRFLSEPVSNLPAVRPVLGASTILVH